MTPRTRAGEQGRPSRAGSQAAERAASLLTYFTTERPRWRLADLAKAVGLHPSTVYRHLAALESLNLVERDEDYGGYKLGLAVLELSTVVLAGLEVRRSAFEEMEDVRDRFNVLVNLGMLRGANVVHIAHAFPPGWPRWNMDLGRTAAAHCTALGKVLLAAVDREEAIARVELSGWPVYTEKSVRDAPHLRAELDTTEDRGYALDWEERRIGTACVAVGVHAANGRTIAALSATALVARMEEIGHHNLATVLRSAAERISSRMGSRGNVAAYL